VRVIGGRAGWKDPGPRADSLVETLEHVPGSSGNPGELRRDSRHSSAGHIGLSVDKASNRRCNALAGLRRASEPK